MFVIRNQACKRIAGLNHQEFNVWSAPELTMHRRAFVLQSKTSIETTRVSPPFFQYSVTSCSGQLWAAETQLHGPMHPTIMEDTCFWRLATVLQSECSPNLRVQTQLSIDLSSSAAIITVFFCARYSNTSISGMVSVPWKAFLLDEYLFPRKCSP